MTFKNCQINRVSGLRLIGALCKYSNISCIDFDGNDIGDKALAVIRRAVAGGRLGGLRRISLENCGLTTEAVKTFLGDGSVGVSQCRDIYHISFDNNQLDMSVIGTVCVKLLRCEHILRKLCTLNVGQYGDPEYGFIIDNLLSARKGGR